MRFQVAELPVVHIEFHEGKREYTFMVELAPGTHLNFILPFEHSVKLGDKIPILVDVPVILQKLPGVGQ